MWTIIQTNVLFWLPRTDSGKKIIRVAMLRVLIKVEKKIKTTKMKEGF